MDNPLNLRKVSFSVNQIPNIKPSDVRGDHTVQLKRAEYLLSKFLISMKRFEFLNEYYIE